MSVTRRDFLRCSTAGAGLCYLTGAGWARQQAASAPAPSTAPRATNGGARMRILILGGTAFLGPAVVTAAQKRGHTLTLFNRGKTNPQLFPEVEKLHGDRNGDLKSLEGKKWDAVVDTSGYVPRMVRASAELLSGAVRQYVFISSISVYSDTSKPGMDESTPLGKLKDEKEEKVTGDTYGPLKAACEQAAEKAMPGRVANIRPGLIVGPDDPSDRFTYWPVRVARGGEVLSPGAAYDPVQFIDVRDLGEWIVRCIEHGTAGEFNATGPKTPLPMGELLASCKKTSGSDARFTWADADFLEKQKVSAWQDMPVWVPPRGDEAGFTRVSCRRAIEQGLEFRPVDATVKDTLDWFKTLPEERQKKLRAGISTEREEQVLAAWHAEKAK